MTLKKYLSISLATATNVKEMYGNELVLVTAAGTIIGHLASEDDEGPKLIPDLVSQIASNYASEFNIDAKDLPDNDGFLTLNNARILSANCTVTFDSLVVFYDQIIGITVGIPHNS